jgi:uncharacterized membrane protein YwzB
MEIKLSDINTLKQINTPKKWIEKVIVVVMAIVLGVITWYILKSMSTVLVIKKDKTGKKICDFN